MHLTLAKARSAAEHITKGTTKLKLKVQMGRHFVLGERGQVLSIGHDWDQAITNLLQATVVFFVNKHGLVIPNEVDFNEVAQAYLDDPDAMKLKWALLGKAEDESVLPDQLLNDEAHAMHLKEKQDATTNA